MQKGKRKRPGSRRIQPRIPGYSRAQLSPRVEQEIKDSIQAVAVQHNVSLSWVTNVLLARYFGIKVERF